MRLRIPPVAVLVLLVEVKKLLCRSCSCCRKKPLSTFCLSPNIFFCASCAAFALLRYEPRLCVLLSRSVRQRPNNLNASLGFVLGCRDYCKLSECRERVTSAESDGRTIVLAVCSMVMMSCGAEVIRQCLRQTVRRHAFDDDLAGLL